MNDVHTYSLVVNFSDENYQISGAKLPAPLFTICQHRATVNTVFKNLFKPFIHVLRPLILLKSYLMSLGQVFFNCISMKSSQHQIFSKKAA
jgi:hypothetical protein